MKKILLLVLFVGTLAVAQSDGLLVGVITTANGEAVRDTRIVLVGISSGLRRETKTDDLGIYAFSLLPPGEYRLEALRGGFIPHGTDRIVLGPGEKRAWRVQWDAADVR